MSDEKRWTPEQLAAFEKRKREKRKAGARSREEKDDVIGQALLDNMPGTGKSVTDVPLATEESEKEAEEV